MEGTCRVPGCGAPAVSAAGHDLPGKHRWDVHLTLSIEDVAAIWPLCAEHAQILIAAALETVGATLTGWGFGTTPAPR